MADQFVTRKELARLMKNFEKKVTGISVRESIKAPSPEQAQSEEFADEQYAGRNDRAADYTDTQSRFGTFVSKLLPKFNINMTVFAFIHITVEVSSSQDIWLQLRNGASGYDAAGTIRGKVGAEDVVAADFINMACGAFFDIPVGSITDAARICADIKKSAAGGTITVWGDTNIGGADIGGCELRIFSVARY